MQLKNKNILITGAGKGIGFSSVIDCLENGANVYALTRSNKDLKRLRKYNNLHIFYGDVTNLKTINRIFIYSRKIKRPINSLVNNAGVRLRKKFEKITNKELKELFEINFFSIFYICQLFIKYLNKTQKASVVNIGSIVGSYGFTELSGYASSKKALEGLTKCLAVEFGHQNINFNCINPGFTKTSYFTNFKKNKKLYNWTLKKISQKRWAESQEISKLVVFLLSDKSSYINGESINIDGGWN
jgi:NAD(P)-dependent dehydrogenase (short-subunit alcohol dehydrogenase family)